VHIAETEPEAAKVGGWELDVASGHLTWTAITFQIYELDQPQAPPLEDMLTFYPAKARLAVQAAVQAAVDAGTPWDIETALVTARGRHRWVRSWGVQGQRMPRRLEDRPAVDDAQRAIHAEAQAFEHGSEMPGVDRLAVDGGLAAHGVEADPVVSICLRHCSAFGAFSDL
jgi:hypothetical protein